MLTIWEHLTVAKQAYEKATDTVCKKHGLKHREFEILMYLYDYPKQATATDIVKRLNLSKSHVSVSLKSLETNGLVIGEYIGSNRRTIFLRLTDKANEVILDGKNAHVEFANKLLSGFSKEEIESLISYLKRVKKNVFSKF